MQPLLSVVIPCFNHGSYIQDALTSVAEIKGIAYEVIIVNDGSTDAFTIQKLAELEAEGYQVIHQTNSGLAATRNRAIAAAKGIYILPLDADNKIRPEYVYKAIPLLESKETDIVYCRPEFFGNVTSGRDYETRSFDILDLSIENYIDACAVYRKDMWEKLGGYDPDMPFMGQEDWEFWIHAYSKGYRFTFLNEQLFFYRVVGNSMIAQMSAADKTSLNHQYLVRKHAEYFSESYRRLYYAHKSHQSDLRQPFRSFGKYLYHYYKSR